MSLTDTARQNLTLALFSKLNHPADQGQQIHSILHVLKNATGYDAVGIRLQENNDFPYYVQTGFSPSFVKLENSLCKYNSLGDPLKDDRGKPQLACLCGLVISNQTNPEMPYFSPRGSFWTNSTSELLKTLSEEELSKLRGRCAVEGYESLALIPLRTDQTTIGLLQFNDHRPNCFTPELITFYEGIATSIAIAFQQIKTQQTMLKLETALREASDATAQRIGHDLHDSLGQLLTGISLCSKALENNLSAQKLPEAEEAGHIAKLSQRATSQCRILAKGLCPIQISPTGFEDALHELAVDTAQSTGVACSFTPAPTPPQLEQKQAINLYQITQEAINNAIKHAHPKHINVAASTQMAGQLIIISIQDDGKGINDNTLTHSLGMGINIMKHRAKSIGGTLTIEPAPNGGTIVRCTVPVSPNNS